MLENLCGDDGVSPDLVKDLRFLSSLSQTESSTIAGALAAFPEAAVSNSAVQKVARQVLPLKIDNEKLKSVLEVTVYIWRRWSRRRLTKAQIVQDLLSIGIGEQEVSNITPLLNVMESKLEFVRRRMTENTSMNTSTPRLDSASFVVDARAIFRDTKHNKDGDESQPYYTFDHFLPLVILEMISELNDKKQTHSYTLREDELNNLYELLDRARKRLQIIKDKIAVAPTREV